MRSGQIENFVSLAQCKSFSEAAEFCFISQPALSKNIQALEKEWGVTLFYRSPHGVELTEAGNYMYELCLREHTIFSKALEEAKKLNNKAQIIRLAMVDGINDALFWEFLHQFYDNLSLANIDFSLSEDGDHSIAVQLMEGKIDCAVTPLSSHTFYSFQNDMFQFIPFYHASHQIYYSRFHPQNWNDRDPIPEDFKESTFFFPANTGRIRTKDGRLMRSEDYFSLQLGFPVKCEFCDNISLIYQNVILDRGVTILLDCTNYGWHEEVRSIPLKLDMEPSELVFIWRKDTTNLALQAMLEKFSMKYHF